MSKKLIWIYSDIHSCNFVGTNIFGHSFVSKFSRMSHSALIQYQLLLQCWFEDVVTDNHNILGRGEKGRFRYFARINCCPPSWRRGHCCCSFKRGCGVRLFPGMWVVRPVENSIRLWRWPSANTHHLTISFCSGWGEWDRILFHPTSVFLNKNIHKC